MRPDEIKKLLGGYATGTLTDAEQQALFAAALEDQQLFDELAREQPLHDLLRDPAARAEMLDAVAERPRMWRWWRPTAAALGMAAIGAVLFVMPRQKTPEPPPQIVAQVKPPEPIPVPPPATLVEAPAPAPAPEPKRKTAKPFQPPPARAASQPAASDTTIVELPKTSNGVVGGVIGGTPGGVLGGIIGPTPAAAPPPPPPVMRSEVPVSPRANFAPSTTAETVQVTAEASPMIARITPSARVLFYGRAPLAMRVQTSAAARTDATPAPRDLGLRYSIVRQDGDTFVPADPANLAPSDTLALRITANVSGFLSIAGAKPIALTAMEPFTTAPLPKDATEIRVIFARAPQTVIAAPVSLTTEVSAGEVYVVNTTPGAPVAFTVTLKRK